MVADWEPGNDAVPFRDESRPPRTTEPEGVPTPTFSYICERDIDLLLVEELRCSPSYQEWFIHRLLPALPNASSLQVMVTEVLHSCTETGQGAGESDIRASFVLTAPDPQRVIAFIENKIDADFQPSQPARYAERARAAREQEDCDCSITVLVAPNEYLETRRETHLFDISISYEDIIAYFEGSGSDNAEGVITRSRHRQEMLEQAVYKYRRGYVPDVDEAVSSFWAEYWEHASKIAPTLRMHRPGRKPSRAGFVHFVDAIDHKPPLPRLTIKHKLAHGRVDLEFAGWADHIRRVAEKVDTLLGEGMTVRKAGHSLAISIVVPKLDTSASFESQREKAEVGLRAATDLQEWFLQETTQLMRIHTEYERQNNESDPG